MLKEEAGTQIGFQQIMIGKLCKNHDTALAALKSAKASGYDYIEINDFMVQKTSFIVKVLTKFGGMSIGNSGNLDWHTLLYEADLKVSSIHSNLGSIENDPKAVADLAKSYGTATVVITGMYRFDYSDYDAVLDLASRLNEAGKALKAEGIELLYHNHNVELQKVSEDKSAYDIIVENTDPEYVNFELDTYWFADGGADIADVMETLGERMVMWHINDRGNKSKGAYMTPIIKEDEAELGCGNMNLKKYAEIAMTNGTRAIILETHNNWIDNDPVKSIQVSGEFLKNLY